MAFKRATVNWQPKPRNPPHSVKRPRTCRTFSALPDFTDRITTLIAVTKTIATQWWLLPWLDINSTLLPLPDLVQQPVSLAPPPQQRPNKFRAIFSLLWCTIALLYWLWFFCPLMYLPLNLVCVLQNNMINKCYLLFQIRDSISFLIINKMYLNSLRSHFRERKCHIISQCQNTPLAGAKYDE